MAQRNRSKKRPPRRQRDRFLVERSPASVAPMPPALAPQAASWRYTLPSLLVIWFAIVTAFAPALQNELVHWDDDTNLMENTFIREFSAENLRRMWTEQVLGVWQPLTWMLTALEYKLFNGANHTAFSRGLHAVNIGLHALGAMFVFVLARRLIGLATPERAARAPLALNLGALAAALFFALHPLRVEIVAWASGQPYMLAFIPALGAVWCYLRAHETGRWSWQAAALGCMAVSLLCKAAAVPLVAVLLVLDVYPLRRLGGRAGWSLPQVGRVIAEKIPYAALVAAAAGMTVWATWANKSYNPEPIINKLLVSGFCFMFYVAITFVPVGIAPYYMKPSPFNAADPQFVGAALGFVLVTVALVIFRRRVPWLLAAWAAYVLILLPVVGLIKHGGQLAADRYTYLSGLAWAVLVGAAVMRLWSAGGAVRAGGALLALAVLFGLGLKTAAYCQVWNNSVSLWTAMVERNPRFHMGFYNLAKAYKRPADAIWQRKLRSSPANDAPGEEELQRARELFAQAERSYRHAIELYPTYPEANVDLGNMMKDGKAEGGATAAMERYETALRGRSAFHMAHWNLAGLLERQGRFAEAARHLEAAEVDAEASRERGKLARIRRDLERVRAKAER